MNRKMLPLNLSLLEMTPVLLQRVPQITSLDITDGPGGNFHDSGLFSTSIFGRVGDPKRDLSFGRIDLRLPVLHPIVYRVLTKMRAFYKGIMMGTDYAIFNNATGEFEKSNELEGQTGYSFFMANWEKLQFVKGNSDIRNTQIDLLEKYKKTATVTQWVVLPAGLRDAEVDAVGRMTFGEINDFYQKLLMLTRNFPERINPQDDLSIYDRTRYATQLTVNAIYEHLLTLIKGKGGVIQAKWASRRVFNGTRNVLSSSDTTAVDLDQPNRPGFNDTIVGMYQVTHAVLPKTIHALKTNLTDSIFNTTSNQVQLINKKTLKLEWVDVTNETMDIWGSEEGLEKVVGELAVVGKRHRPVEIEGHYLALVYVDTSGNFKLFRDVEELPEGFSRKHVRPMSYIEMFYITGLDLWYNTVGFITRYPVENFNSSSPVSTYTKTTLPGELRYGLDHNWQRDESIIAKEYPKLDGDQIPYYFDSLGVPQAKLSPMGGDFDGDTCSYVATYATESIREANEYFKKRRAYIQAGGGLAFGVDIHTLNMTLRFITGAPRPRGSHAV